MCLAKVIYKWIFKKADKEYYFNRKMEKGHKFTNGQQTYERYSTLLIKTYKHDI